MAALRPALLAFARRLARSEAEAEDLVQEAIARALAAEDRFQPGTRLKSWLFTILRNRFNTGYVRNRRLVPMDPRLLDDAHSAAATQETDLWAAETVRRLLDDLTPAHREVLILIPVLGLPYEDAATLCGCSVGTVKSRLNRARQALHRDPHGRHPLRAEPGAAKEPDVAGGVQDLLAGDAERAGDLRQA